MSDLSTFFNVGIPAPSPREHSSANVSTFDTAGYVPCEIASAEIDTLKHPTSATTALVGYLNTTQVWSVAYTDVDATADKWGGLFWVDLTNKKVWVSAARADDKVQIATIDLTDGTVSTVGAVSAASTTASIFDASTSQFTHRATEATGDLTVYNAKGYYVINGTTGAISGETAFTPAFTPGYVTIDKQFMFSNTFSKVTRLSDLSTQKIHTSYGMYDSSFTPYNLNGVTHIGDDRVMFSVPFTAIVPYSTHGRVVSWSDFDRFLMKVGVKLMP